MNDVCCLMNQSVQQRLFDNIIEQLISGVRNNGRYIDFHYHVDQREVCTLDVLRERFVTALQTAGPSMVLLDQATDEGVEEYDELVNTITATLPILSAVHADDRDSFVRQIDEACKALYLPSKPASSC